MIGKHATRTRWKQHSRKQRPTAKDKVSVCVLWKLLRREGHKELLGVSIPGAATTGSWYGPQRKIAMPTFSWIARAAVNFVVSPMSAPTVPALKNAAVDFALPPKGATTVFALLCAQTRSSKRKKYAIATTKTLAPF